MRVVPLALLLFSVAALPLSGQNPFLDDQRTEQSDTTAPDAAAGFRVFSGVARQLQEGIARLSRLATQGEWVQVVPALLLAVVFGAVHIVGPGHGKVFAVSYFSGRESRLREGFAYSAIVNLVDSVAALALVGVGYGLLSLTLRSVQVDAGRILQIVSYSLVTVLGVVHLVSHLLPHRHQHGPSDKHEPGRPDNSDDGDDGDNGAGDSSRGGRHDHANGTHDGGRRRGRKPPWALAISVGLVPCPVSTVLFVYGVANGILPFMALMVVGVSLGGFVTLSLLTSAVIAGRGFVFGRIRTTTAARLGTILEFATSGLIIAFGVLLLLAAV